MSENTVQVIEPTIERPHGIGGTQRMYRFANDYGASVVRFEYMGAGSYGASEGLWEMAVIRYGADGKFELVYDTPVTDDVIGWLDEDAIQEKLRQIRDLSARTELAGGAAPEPTNPDRRCRNCGATSGLKMLHRNPLTLADREWECYDGCPGGVS